MQSISESLKKQREQILTDGSENMLVRHTSLLEIAVISLYNRLVNRLSLDTEQFRASGAIIALGELGRGLIGPNQPVRLLFLKADSSSPMRQSWLDEIIGPLIEAGWTVELQQENVESVLNGAKKDFDRFLGLLEIRYISGNRQLVEQFEKSLDGMIEEDRERLLTLLYDSVEGRKDRLEYTESWLEPDLVQNPGGLADINAIGAACRIASGIHTLDDAIFMGYLTRQEVDFIQRAEKSYARLINLLRSISGVPSGVLHFDEQELLAVKLGYSERAGFLAVENFMQSVFQDFHGVSFISSEFWERLHESRGDVGKAGTAAPVPLEEGLFALGGKVHIQTDKYEATAGHLVHLFRVAAERRLGFANVTRQWIRHHRNVLNAASGDATVKSELLGLIRADTYELPVFRRFYDQGLLFCLIPELVSVHGLMQHDAFHLYPVQEHHLRTVSEMKKMLAGDYAATEPEVTRVALEQEDPTWVLLAGFLHDAGKSSGGGHAAAGGEMIPAIGRRLGLTPEESEKVRFLVAQHLVLMDNASLRDLADQEMLAHCAFAIRDPKMLDLLLLLSFTDMAATGPKARQKWRDTPVIQLYGSIRHILEKGEPSPEAIAERVEQVKNQVRHEVADLMSNEELEAYFSQLVPRYLLSTPPKAVAKHLRMEKQLQSSGALFVWEVSAADGNTAEITIMNWERPGLLSRSAGVFTLHDMNILQAQVFTLHPGVTLLIFQCRLPENEERGIDWNAVRNDMERLLKGKMALDYRIAQRALAKPPLQEPLRSGPSQILVDNESSGMYTILEVYSVDRVGLLYTISRTLFELQIRIYVAKITTKVDQVADVFYVRTHNGEKMTDPEQIDELKKALHFWLDAAEDNRPAV